MSYLLSSYIDTLKDWPWGTVVGLTLTATGLLLAGLVVGGCYYLADSAFRPLKTAPGKVLDKTYTPPRTQLLSIYNSATKTTDLTPISHPSSWDVDIEFAGVTGSFNVEESLYRQLRVGDSVDAQYVVGRFSNQTRPRFLQV